MMLKTASLLWSRVPLAGRLIAVLAVCSILASVWMLGNQLAQDSARSRESLRRQAVEEIESLIPAVADQALIGDYTAIQQIAGRYARHANVALVRWNDGRGGEVAVVDPPKVVEVPLVFHRWLGLAEIEEVRPVTVGGRAYGTLTLRISPDPVERHLWQTLCESAAILAAAWLVGAVAVVAVIGRSTASLTELDTAVRQVRSGELGARLVPRGAPEIRRLISGFNAMSESLAQAHHAMRLSLAETEAARAELSRFSEILTHHLQEPVRQIVSFSQILESGDDGDMGSLGFIKDGAIRLRSLLADIELYLALSHLPETTSLQPAGPALADALTALGPVIRETGAVIEAGDLPMVWLDQRRLSSLFKELIANAIEYRSPDRAPRITMTADRMGDMVHLAVADNGIGIKSEYFERIFGVFNRLHTRQTHPGNGIGLAIVRKIVAGAGGEIMVQSTYGLGTTFSFTLPSRQPVSPPP